MTPELFLFIVTGVIGSCWGSFLNAAYYRSYENKSLFNPPSFCPKCKTPIKPWYNLPVIGWLLARGKCSHCHLPISIHYPLMELAVGLLFATIFTFLPNPVSACLVGAIVSLLIMGAIFDHHYFLLPDVVLNFSPLLALALVVSAPSVLSLGTQGLSATVFSAVAGGILSVLFLYLIKKTGEMFLTRKEEINGSIWVDAEGVTLTYADGKKEKTTWPEFVFAKVIPKGHLVLDEVECPEWKNSCGQQAPYILADGDLVIYDEYAEICGHRIDITKGFSVKADALKIHRNAMGMGDVRLVGTLGILLGFNAGLYETLFLACCTGLVHGLYLRRKDRRLPFGPHLMVATAYILASRHALVPPISDLLTKLGGH